MFYVCVIQLAMAKIDDVIKTRFQNDKHRFMANLMFTSNHFQNLFNEFITPFGISSQQFNILRILRGADDWVTMNTIKGLMIDKSPNTTRLADKLNDKELVERKRSENDRRVVYLKITKKGLDLLKEIDRNEKGPHQDFIKRIDDEKAIEFSNFLDELRG